MIVEVSDTTEAGSVSPTTATFRYEGTNWTYYSNPLYFTEFSNNCTYDNLYILDNVGYDGATGDATQFRPYLYTCGQHFELDSANTSYVSFEAEFDVELYVVNSTYEVSDTISTLDMSLIASTECRSYCDSIAIDNVLSDRTEISAVIDLDCYGVVLKFVPISYSNCSSVTFDHRSGVFYNF